MSPMKRIGSILEGPFARLAKHVQLFNTETSTTRCTSFLQLSNVSRSLQGFKQGKCQRLALASKPPEKSRSMREVATFLPAMGSLLRSFSGTQSAPAAPAHVTMQHLSQKRKPSRCIVLCFARHSRDARNSPSSVTYAEDRDADNPKPTTSWPFDNLRATRLGHVQ